MIKIDDKGRFLGSKENLIIFLVNLQVTIEENSQSKSLNMEKISRNTSCPCGSNKKYKNWFPTINFG